MAAASLLVRRGGSWLLGCVLLGLGWAMSWAGRCCCESGLSACDWDNVYTTYISTCTYTRIKDMVVSAALSRLELAVKSSRAYVMRFGEVQEHAHLAGSWVRPYVIPVEG